MQAFKRREFRHCPSAWGGYRLPAEHSTMKESPYDIAVAQIANEKIGRYEKTFRPVYRSAIREVNAMDTPGRMNQVADLAQSGVMHAGESALKQLPGAMAGRGAAPGSPEALMARSGLRQATAGGAGNAGFMAQQGLKDAQLKGLQNLVDIGSNRGGVAQQSLSAVADLAQQKGRAELESALLESQGMGQALGTAAGLGMGYGMTRRGA